MIILIAGGSHTGKTVLAQKLLEKYQFPYLSIDHVKMGLIRSGCCDLTPYSSTEELTDYLWPIIREMVKTNIENHQNLIVEGCYIPFDCLQDFDEEYREQIRYVCLVFSEEYIEQHFEDILNHADVIENRVDDSCCTQSALRRENRKNLEMCRKYGCNHILITDRYSVDFSLDEETSGKG